MAMLPRDYVERVYAGVLGKIIGVYLGSPFEGWTYERILRELGPIHGYVNERLGRPLIVPDDDIAGTFTFLRAMADYRHDPALTPAQIGQTWLNYLIEGKTVLWWGGMGNSTEHTAYLRLKAGVAAPESGSIARNGRVVAEQIGAQIFIDGWAMLAPGDPARAADLARRAASVSHDGEAIYGAQVLAAMEALAFVERDVDALLDAALALIPPDCLIRRLIDDLRGWRARFDRWQDAFAQVQAHYGYDKYGGNCHMIPNHAVIILALLYGGHSVSEALSVANTCGWDTDCNSGNVGCLMGIKEGLAGLGLDHDWRGPVADRLYLPTADGGRTVTDALSEALRVVEMGCALADQPFDAPKGGARYHFCLPGSVQGWLADDGPAVCATRLANVMMPGQPTDERPAARCLAIRFEESQPERPARVQRETYPAYVAPGSGYGMVAGPQLYAGQRVTATLLADAANAADVEARLYVRWLGAAEQPGITTGPSSRLAPGQSAEIAWNVQTEPGALITWVGLELCTQRSATGTVYLDTVHWGGVPAAELVPARPTHSRWVKAWVSAVHQLFAAGDHPLRLVHNSGLGMALQGLREWQDYKVSAQLVPHLAQSFGIAVRVQGLRRYYALRLTLDGRAQLLRELDGTLVLAECACPWALYQSSNLALTAVGDHLWASVNGVPLFDVRDEALSSGAVGLLIEEGRLGVDWVQIAPAAEQA